MSTKTPFWLGGVAASRTLSITDNDTLIEPLGEQFQRLAETNPHSSQANADRKSPPKWHEAIRILSLTASLLRQMTYSLVRLGSYESAKVRMSVDGPPSTGQLLVAAAIAGGLGGIAGNPADILLVRMTTDGIRPPEKQYRYPNALAGLVSLIREEGAKGLTRGLGANTTRAVLMNASQVATYDFFKARLHGRYIPLLDVRLRDSLLLHTISSFLAGAVATTVCSPADVLKSRLMSSSSDHGVFHILRSSLRKEGPSFLFKGWTPAFIRLGPNTVLLFIFFEQLKKGWNRLP